MLFWRSTATSGATLALQPTIVVYSLICVVRTRLSAIIFLTNSTSPPLGANDGEWNVSHHMRTKKYFRYLRGFVHKKKTKRNKKQKKKKNKDRIKKTSAFIFFSFFPFLPPLPQNEIYYRSKHFAVVCGARRLWSWPVPTTRLGFSSKVEKWRIAHAKVKRQLLLRYNANDGLVGVFVGDLMGKKNDLLKKKKKDHFWNGGKVNMHLTTVIESCRLFDCTFSEAKRMLSSSTYILWKES